jgi:hypothetical protein
MIAMLRWVDRLNPQLGVDTLQFLAAREQLMVEFRMMLAHELLYRRLSVMTAPRRATFAAIVAERLLSVYSLATPDESSNDLSP